MDMYKPKRDARISVSFTESEKNLVSSALAVYGDVAGAARMILLAFAEGHNEQKKNKKCMKWPPECVPEKSELTDDLRQEMAKIADDRIAEVTQNKDNYLTKNKKAG